MMPDFKECAILMAEFYQTCRFSSAAAARAAMGWRWCLRRTLASWFHLAAGSAGALADALLAIIVLIAVSASKLGHH